MTDIVEVDRTKLREFIASIPSEVDGDRVYYDDGEVDDAINDLLADELEPYDLDGLSHPLAEPDGSPRRISLAELADKVRDATARLYIVDPDGHPELWHRNPEGIVTHMDTFDSVQELCGYVEVQERWSCESWARDIRQAYETFLAKSEHK